MSGQDLNAMWIGVDAQVDVYDLVAHLSDDDLARLGLRRIAESEASAIALHLHDTLGAMARRRAHLLDATAPRRKGTTP